MKPSKRCTAVVLAMSLYAPAAWPEDAHLPAKVLDTVIVRGPRPSSLPTRIPTTFESIGGDEIEQRINATDSEDALKYFPSLTVRKRYIGDYDHAVLASRASGTGNSARSLVYADGILLSNLLGNGASFTPRWGLVSPEEIERVDVLYGPFSAAYPGNSAGAVVDFQTRMPDRLEAHVKLSAFTQGFQLYRSDERFGGRQGSASVGNRQGQWSWWIDASRLDSRGQPLGFASKLLSSGVASGAGVPVSGAIPGKNPANRDWLLIGTNNQAHTVQDHAKVKLAYDVSPTLRASYTLGWWGNETARSGESYLVDAAGAPVYHGDAAGAVNIGGKRFELRAADFAPSASSLEHVIHGLSIKRHGKSEWEWEVAASSYDYARDLLRTPSVLVSGLDADGPGTLTDMAGSGWHTLALRASWRPDAQHVVEAGLQSDSAKLRTRIARSADWQRGGEAAPLSRFNGNTRLQSAYVQDTWRFAADWKTTLGARLEHWRAYGGELESALSGGPRPFAGRSERAWSPKAALAWQATPEWALKSSLGRAVRNPTAAELFQGSLVGSDIVNSDPSLRAERSWTGELTGERMAGGAVFRATLFHEGTRDALYSQPLTASVNTVQNVGKIRTTGLELSHQAENALVDGLALSSSLTFADSKIVENRGLPASVGKRQPRVPRWRGNLLASYHAGEQWSATFGARYSGRQFGTLDNSDPNGDAYTGVSDYFVTDVRVRYRFDRQWSAALGIDNLNNAKYWAFHPYTQRTVLAELRFDL